jgi:hypothetical protein
MASATGLISQICDRTDLFGSGGEGDFPPFIIDACDFYAGLVSDGVNDVIRVFTPVQQHAVVHGSLQYVAHAGNRFDAMPEILPGVPVKRDCGKHKATANHNNEDDREELESEQSGDFHTIPDGLTRIEGQVLCHL